MPGAICAALVARILTHGGSARESHRAGYHGCRPRLDATPCSLRRDKPLWDQVTHLLISDAEAERQREIVLSTYRALCARITEAEQLRSSVAEWSRSRVAHPVFGTIRFETIATWRSRRHGTEPLGERVLDRLRAEVARRVAVRIGARMVR